MQYCLPKLVPGFYQICWRETGSCARPVPAFAFLLLCTQHALARYLAPAVLPAAARPFMHSPAHLLRVSPGLAGPCPALVLAAVVRGGNSPTNKKAGYLGCIRHKDVLRCAHGAMARWMVRRYTIDKVGCCMSPTLCTCMHVECIQQPLPSHFQKVRHTFPEPFETTYHTDWCKLQTKSA